MWLKTWAAAVSNRAIDEPRSLEVAPSSAVHFSTLSPGSGTSFLASSDCRISARSSCNACIWVSVASMAGCWGACAELMSCTMPTAAHNSASAADMPREQLLRPRAADWSATVGRTDCTVSTSRPPFCHTICKMVQKLRSIVPLKHFWYATVEDQNRKQATS